MRNTTAAVLALATAVALTGCETMTDTQRNTALGVGIGALAGAGIAKATGGKAGTGALIGAAVGGVGTYIWSANMERQRQELEDATRGTGVTVSRTADNQLQLAIPSDISFDSNSATIKSQFRPVLNSFTDSLRRNPGTHVVIVGHTDSTGGAHINDPLSLNRANAARDYIFNQGVRGPRIQTEGRGAREPVASNESAWGRAKNRRIDIFVAQAQ
ncbi:OmpA family protein [Comamonas aquatica]|uniref:OmpA family protein n=2 Tax=Comamonas aquatica TaxID=225991 RepID=UPI0005A62B59|nr:OmpA family protein [Comamonas aquatica]MDH0372353.1 OmpA family protein [Comamonas aquatica]MDH0383624.1 OmpA family protein [Comamonas aquatica]MDH0431638.1 OmpA family protein [Comamonas aquatica]MDH0942727.1 OmpA family protein [Comamonas aquatica]